MQTPSGVGAVEASDEKGVVGVREAASFASETLSPQPIASVWTTNSQAPTSCWSRTLGNFAILGIVLVALDGEAGRLTLAEAPWRRRASFSAWPDGHVPFKSRTAPARARTAG
jgi:hypothetical protein